MNRRDFLRPRRLARSTGEALGAWGSPPGVDTPGSPPRELALLRVGRRAMATNFEVLLPYGTPCAMEAAEAALHEVDRLEAQLPVYRDSSEVSRLNRLAAAAAVPVEESLYRLVALAARISAETAGAYDISTGALTKAWGFYRRCHRIP